MTAVALFGENFMFDTYLFSNNGYEIPHLKRMTFAKLQERLAPILFSKETKEGIVLTSENLLRMQKFSFIIFAKTKKRSMEIEARMIELLNAGQVSN